MAQVAGDQVASSLRVGRGALVQAVEPSSNAAKAGLQGTRRTLSGIAAGKLCDITQGLWHLHSRVKLQASLLGFYFFQQAISMQDLWLRLASVAR